MTNPLILLIFLCQGLGLQAKQLSKGSQLIKAFCWGLVISQGMGPILGYLAVGALQLQADSQVGFIIICSMAPTLVSGAVLATKAGGDSATALVLAVGINLLGIVTIPLNLQWSLGAVVQLDTLGLLVKLVFLVLVPAVAGQLMRRWQPDWAHKQERYTRNIPVIALGIIVYMSCSSQADRLRELTLEHLGALLLPSVTVHLILLAVAYSVGKYLFRIQESASRSVAIVCSQKTLPIAIAVWSIAFAQPYPLAVLPALVFHPSQILLDGALATLWARKKTH
jgi:predicted Na+-dependent transporter